MGDLSRIAYPMIIGMLNTKCGAMHPIGQPSTNPSLKRFSRCPICLVNFYFFTFSTYVCTLDVSRVTAISARINSTCVNGT